jgi:hypothetical protein
VQELSLRKQVAQEMGFKLSDGQKPGPIDLTNPKTQKVIDKLYDTLTKKGFLKVFVSKFEKPKTGHYDEALEKLTSNIEVTDANLQSLAIARGEAIQKTLITYDITPDRVYLDTPVKIKPEGKVIPTKLTIDVKGAKNKTFDHVNSSS